MTTETRPCPAADRVTPAVWRRVTPVALRTDATASDLRARMVGDWICRHWRENPDATLPSALNAYDDADDDLPGVDHATFQRLWAEATEPATVADNPAGQGPASLYLQRDPAGVLHLMMATGGEPAVVVWGEAAPTPGEAALFALLAAHVPTVTADTKDQAAIQAALDEETP